MLTIFVTVRDQVRVMIWLTQFHRGLWRLVQGWSPTGLHSDPPPKLKQGRKQVVWKLVGCQVIVLLWL